ncbi:MAG: hypothetical protein K8T89_11325 [Planctomycetes bacterium]|nr:hypothetical protein [Planctomycetota bacterium]
MPSTEELKEARRKLTEQNRKLREAERLAGTDYDRHRGDMAGRSREAAARGIDIGELPSIKDPARREACRLDLQLALKTYWPERFSLPWSQDQIDVIKLIQRIVLEGGRAAFAIYRGGGKTTICEAAAEWAELNGHRKFCVIIGSTGEAAAEILSSIQLDLETNDLLLEDFPEAIYPIRKLEGEARRCARQTHQGVRTRIEWSATGIAFPNIPGAVSAGAIVHVVGMTGRIRGLKRGNLRPDLLLIDDPQTDDTAISPISNAKR